MELRYTLTDIREGYNDTCVIPKTTRILVRNNIIIDADERIVKYAKGKNIDVFLTQCYAWGNRFDVEVKLVGISGLVKLFRNLEDNLNPDKRKWIQIWYGNRFGYLPYETEEEKQEILETHKDSFTINKNHRETIPLKAIPKVKKQPVKQFVLEL